MNTRLNSILTFSILALLLTASAQGVELLTNGNFESFTSGLPTSWTYFRGDGPATLESTANVSPFTNVYPSSTRSLLFTDGSTDSLPDLNQFFPAQTGSVLLSFEFRLSAFAGDPWLCLPDTSGSLVLTNIRFGGSAGTFSLIDNTGFTTILNLTVGTWYQVSVLFNLPASTYSGSVTPFGGSATTWTNRVLTQSANFGRVDFDDLTSAQNGPVAIDNVSVQAVPEPSALAFGTLTVLSALALRLRRKLTNARA